MMRDLAAPRGIVPLVAAAHAIPRDGGPAPGCLGLGREEEAG